MEPSVPQKKHGSSSVALSDHDPIAARFLPFHAADVRGLASTVHGQYGVDRTEVYYVFVPGDGKTPGRMEMRTRIVTDWYHCQPFTLPPTDYPMAWPVMQLYAGYRYPRELVEKALGSAAAAEHRPLARAEVAHDGCTSIDPFECKQHFAQGHSFKRLTQMETSRAHKAILTRHPFAHRAHVDTIHLHMDALRSYKWHSYLVPAYVYQPERGDVATLRFVHGFTGEVSGRAQWSKYKIVGAAALAGAAGGAAAVAAELLLGVPLLQAAMVSTGGAAALAWLLVEASRAWQRHSEKGSLASEREENEAAPLSEHDEFLRKLLADAGESASESASEVHSHGSEGESGSSAVATVQLGGADASLLGVPPGSRLTLPQLRLAYFQQLRQCHPDVYSGNDPAAATAQAQLLNARYSALAADIKAASASARGNGSSDAA